MSHLITGQTVALHRGSNAKEGNIVYIERVNTVILLRLELISWNKWDSSLTLGWRIIAITIINVTVVAGHKNTKRPVSNHSDDGMVLGCVCDISVHVGIFPFLHVPPPISTPGFPPQPKKYHHSVLLHS
jgi:hypothetical protein